MTDHLERGRSVLFLVPAMAPVGVEEAARGAIDRRSRRTVALDMGEIASGRGAVADRVFSALGLERGAGVVVGPTDLAAHQELRHTVLWMDTRSVSQGSLPDIGRFLTQFTRAAEQIDHSVRPVVLALWPGMEAQFAPPAEPALAQMWWWGRISHLDTAVWVSELTHDMAIDPCVIEEVAELSAFDLDLADRMVSEWRGELQRLAPLVAAYAQERGVGPEHRARLPVGGGMSEAGTAPPSEARALWDLGLCERWGSAVLLHATLLVDRPEFLLRRVWQAQVRQLFPVLEMERQRIGTWVGEHRGVLAEGCRELDGIAELEIGPLARVVFASPGLGCSPQRRALLHWMVETRNRLAHLSALDISQLGEGRRLIRGDKW
jgi:hypothetical protein